VKKLILIALAVCATCLVSAAEVTAAQAQAAVDAWLRDDAALGCTLGGAAESTRTCAATNGAPFHVVKLAGGGFVVTSADTTLEPIIAFSDGDDLIESEENPLWTLLTRDLALRMADAAAASGTKGRLKLSATSSGNSANEAKWNRLLGKSSGLLRASQGVSFVSDVRVAPLVQSKWNQGAVGDDPCYNYYTPNHYICGCVATAGAQIMRYFEWPRSDVSVAQFANTHCAVDGATRTLTMQGGYYDWSQMPLAPDGSITETQRQAIGKLTSDIGICVGMSYASDGSSAGGFMLSEAFTNHYGYANALAAQWQSDVDVSGREDVKNALLSNLDAGLPVAVSLSGAGGHEIVGDGYGYSGDTLYLHFNMGWSGSNDAWYAPPNMGTSQYNFSILNGFVCNVFTNSADKGGVICSGRVLDASGSPIANAVVSAKKSGTVVKSATTNAKGIYALVLPADSYLLSASSGDSSATTNVTLSANVGTEIIASGMYADVYYGLYWPGEITIGNRCGQDITITGVAGVAEPQFNPASCLFYPSTNVTITCVTEGATIRYTLDGTDPTESSPLYTGPITVDDDTEIHARAWKSGMNPSAVVAEIYTYDAAQGAPKGDYFADPIKIAGASGSRVIDDNTAYTVEDGEPLHTRRPRDGGGYTYNYQYRTAWYKWTAPGSGTMTLQTSCSGGGYIYSTYIAVYTGDTLTLDNRLAFAYEYDKSTYVTTLNLDVEQGVTYRIVGMMGYDGSGRFTLTWSGDLTVVPTETVTTDVPVPHSWLETYLPELSGVAGAEDYETAAVADSDGDGFANWQEYLLGTDPTNETSRFFATIDFVNGQPVFGWSVTNASLEARGYKYSPKGTTSLALPNWEDWDGHPFFKVVIEPNP
jgi:hypothetical protein